MDEEKAFGAFISVDYKQCKALLHSTKSGNSRSASLKASHNLAVCSFREGAATKAAGEALLADLLQLRDNCNELDDNNPLSPADVAILSFNIATLYIHMKQYVAAERELEILFLNEWHVGDDFFALLVAVVATDVHLFMRHLTKASETLAFLEEKLSSKSEGDELPHTISDGVSEGSGDDHSHKDTDKSRNALPLSAVMPSVLLSQYGEFTRNVSIGDVRLAVRTRRVRLNLLEHKLVGAKRLIFDTLVQCGESPHHITTRYACALMKCHLEYTRCNPRKALRLMLAPDTSPSAIPKLSHKADACGQYPAPLVPILAGVTGGGDLATNHAVFHFNNCAVAMMRSGRIALAAEMLTSALAVSHACVRDPLTPERVCDTVLLCLIPSVQLCDPPPQASSDEKISLRAFASNRRLEVLYNVGVCLLLLGKPFEAARYLRESSQIMSHFPSLWLRLAECCVVVARGNLSRHNGPISRIAESLGVPKRNSASVPSDEFDVELSPSYGILCCRNAMALIDSTSFVPSRISDEKTRETTASHRSAVEEGDMHSMRMMANLHLSYLSLLVGDYVTSIQSCQCILSSLDGPNSIAAAMMDLWKLLAHVYAGEACLMLKRDLAAIDHLSSALEMLGPHAQGKAVPKEVNVHAAFGGDSNFVWNADVGALIDSLRAEVLCDLAIAYFGRSEMDKACSTARQAMHADPSGPNNSVRLVYAYSLFKRGDVVHAKGALFPSDSVVATWKSPPIASVLTPGHYRHTGDKRIQQ